jgi:uncharacterized protein
MEITGIILFFVFSIAGIVLIFLSMPGTVGILAGSFLYALLTGFKTVGWKLLGIFFIMTVAAELSDNLLSMLGARKSGASNASTWAVLAGGMVGAVIGNTAVPVIGAFIGAFLVGAAAPVLLEFSRRKEWKPALKAGIGALAGRLGGILVKFLIAGVMIGVTLIKIF